jgi:hypothetical protein
MPPGAKQPPALPRPPRYDPAGNTPGQYQANVLAPPAAVSSTAAKKPPPPSKPLRPPPPKAATKAATPPPKRPPPPRPLAKSNPPSKPPPKLAAKPPPPARSPPAGASSAGALQPALDLHNLYRKRHRAPALVWDRAVASTAAAWASRCAWGHDQANMRYGENLFIVSGAAFNQSSGLEIWYNEVRGMYGLGPWGPGGLAAWGPPLPRGGGGGRDGGRRLLRPLPAMLRTRDPQAAAAQKRAPVASTAGRRSPAAPTPPTPRPRRLRRSRRAATAMRQARAAA